MIFWISAAAFCVLLLRPLKTSFVVAPVIAIALALCLLHADESRQKGEKKRFAAAALLSLLLGGVFVAVWLRTMRVVALQFIDWGRSLPVLIAAAVSVPLAVPFLRRLLDLLASERGAAGSGTMPKAGALTGERLYVDGRDRLFLLLVAAAVMTVCSLSSPLYPFNNWVDANAFFTVGKSVWSGVVPYRDLVEHKGPLLYALYALAYPVSHRSFFGVWLLEIVAAYLFLKFAFLTMTGLMGRKSRPALLLVAVLTYTAPSFLKGGGAEEFCLPLLMLALWYGSDAVLRNRELTGREAFLIGLTSGAVFWVKYSMLGFYVGFILVPAWMMLRRGHLGKLLKLLLLILAGVAAVSLPVLLYFGLNGALGDLWQVYFLNNIFDYGKSSSALGMIWGLMSGAASMLTFNDATVLLVLFAVICLFRERQTAYGAFVGLGFAFAFFVIYMGGVNLKYYSEILCIFLPVGVAVLGRAAFGVRDFDERTGTPGSGKERRLLLRRLAAACLFCAALLGNENSALLGTKRADMPQYQFAETIAETENATLFTYALDVGQYTVSDIVPTCRYFCMLNIRAEEMFRELEHYMAEGATDYIVSRGLEVDSPCYALVQTATFADDGGSDLAVYYLYRRTF